MNLIDKYRKNTKNFQKKQIDEMCSNNSVAKLDKHIILAKESTEREETSLKKEEITKQKQEDTKQKELELEQLKIKLELAKIGKNEPIKETIKEPLKNRKQMCIQAFFK
jgi:hypothetical protein